MFQSSSNDTQLLILWTANAVIVQITYYTGGNLDVRPESVDLLSDRDIEILTWGSQLEFASWYTYPGVICTLDPFIELTTLGPHLQDECIY